MILEEKDTKIARLGRIKESKFKISEENQTHIIRILRDSMYSNKVLAVLREYSTNAYDEHVKKGIENVPIEVHLPNILDTHLRIRDFGPGLSEQEIREIYCVYGESTKRKSNDFTGMLGIGSKSAFAYTSAFTITSIQNGKKSIYTAFLDETDQGAIAKISESNSQEPDGIEISVPVLKSDINAFTDEAAKLFSFFKVEPKVTGSSLYSRIRNDNKEEPALEGDCWKIFGSNIKTSSYIVMGNIGYPVSADSIKNIEDDHYNLLKSGIQIEVPIGEVDISSSREALQYTNKTEKTIKKYLDKIINDLNQIVIDKIKTAKNIIEAKKIYGNIFDNYRLQAARAAISSKKFTYKTYEIENSSFSYKNCEFHLLHTLNYASKPSRYKEQSSARLNEEDLIVLDDDSSKRWIVKSQLLLESEKKNKLWLVKLKDNNFDDFLKDTGLCDIKTYKLSELPDKPKTKTTRKPKSYCSVYKFKSTISGYGWPSDFWEQTDIDKNKGGVYVEIYKYLIVKDNNRSDPSRLTETLRILKDKGHTIDVIGIKSSKIEKFKNDPNWITLEDFIKKNINSIFPTTIQQEIADYKSLEIINTHKSLFKNESVKIVKSIVENLSCDFVKLITEGNNISNKDKTKILTSINEINEIGRIFDTKDILSVKPKVDLEQLLNQIYDKYPLLSTINMNRYSYHDFSNKSIEDIAKYVNAINKTY